MFSVGLVVAALGGFIAGWARARSRPVPPPPAGEDFALLYREEHRKRMETVGFIASIERQRDGYARLYRECALEMGAGQGLMAEEISRLVGLCKKHNINVRDKESLREMLRAFEQKWGAEARAKQDERIARDRREPPSHIAAAPGSA